MIYRAIRAMTLSGRNYLAGDDLTTALHAFTPAAIDRLVRFRRIALMNAAGEAVFVAPPAVSAAKANARRTA